MKQAREHAALTVRVDMAIGPGGRGTVVGREQCILCRVAVDHLCQIASGNTAIVARSDFSVFRVPIPRVAFHIPASERGVGALYQHRQPRLHCRFYVADNALLYRTSSAPVGPSDIE